MKEEELPLSHKDNEDINNDNPDCSAPSILSGSKNKNQKKQKKIKRGRKKGIEEGEKEMENGISEGERWFRIGWPIWVM